MESTKYYLGLDVSGTNMVAGVVDENHQIIAKESIPTQAGRTIEEITTDMAGSQQKSGSQSRLANGRHLFLGHRHAQLRKSKDEPFGLCQLFRMEECPLYDYLKKHISLPHLYSQRRQLRDFERSWPDRPANIPMPSC